MGGSQSRGVVGWSVYSVSLFSSNEVAHVLGRQPLSLVWEGRAFWFGVCGVGRGSGQELGFVSSRPGYPKPPNAAPV